MKISEIVEAIAELEDDRALALVKESIASGLDSVDVLQNGITAGLREIGRRFEAGEYYLAELVMGGKLAEQCIAILEPHLPAATGPKRGVVVIGAVQGDLHDIGYKLVARQLGLAGYEVHDLGVNVAPMVFINKAQEVKADFIGASAFLITTIALCGDIVKYLQDMGIRDQYRVIIGGAMAGDVMAKQLGVDGWANNALEAVGLCDRLMGHAAVA